MHIVYKHISHICIFFAVKVSRAIIEHKNIFVYAAFYVHIIGYIHIFSSARSDSLRINAYRIYMHIIKLQNLQKSYKLYKIL